MLWVELQHGFHGGPKCVDLQLKPISPKPSAGICGPLRPKARVVCLVAIGVERMRIRQCGGIMILRGKPGLRLPTYMPWIGMLHL